MTAWNPIAGVPDSVAVAISYRSDTASLTLRKYLLIFALWPLNAIAPFGPNGPRSPTSYQALGEAVPGGICTTNGSDAGGADPGNCEYLETPEAAVTSRAATTRRTPRTTVPAIKTGTRAGQVSCAVCLTRV